ncbi:MAG: DUF4136 domain-containing protein [Parahaliea sp.]
MTSFVQPCIKVFIALAASTLLAACASSPLKPDVDYKQDYDFVSVKRIAFYAGSGKVSGDNKMQLSDMQKDRVNNALAYALGQKGFTLVDDANQADILLSWHLVTQFKTDVSSYSDPMMYGPYYGYNRYSMYSCWSCAGATEVISRNYTDGYFIIDMIDPVLKKSVWRSSIHSRLTGKEKLRDEASVNAAALNILSDFPPGAIKQ